MRPWERRRFDGLSVTAVPALHVAPAVGYVVEIEGKRIYFAGDTFHRPFMAAVGRQLQPHVALIPVTTFRIPMTMGEEGAARAVGDLEPSVVIPIHLGVVPRSPLLRTAHTPEGFARRVRAAGLKTEVVVLAEGESWEG
jgi:L-ascorbate metabolism protein UlaG (beta-lactamase superfamily)